MLHRARSGRLHFVLKSMKTQVRFLWWSAAALIAGVIFFLSSRPNPGLGSAPLDQFASIVAHLALYSSLAFAFQHASGWREFKGAVLAVLLVGLYGASDEIHQAFVPGRDASFVDFAIDLVGAITGTAAAVR